MTKKNFKKPIHLAASDGNEYRAMDYLHFEDGNIVATDGHVIVVQALSLHGFTEDEVLLMEGMAIHRKEFKGLMGYTHVTVTKNGFVCLKGETETIIPLKPLSEQTDERFVNYKNQFYGVRADEKISEIGLNLDLLSRIKKMTMNNLGHVNITFKHNGKVCLIKGVDIEGEQFLLMSLEPQ